MYMLVVTNIVSYSTIKYSHFSLLEPFYEWIDFISTIKIKASKIGNKNAKRHEEDTV